MTWQALLTWTGPALDVLVLLGLAAIGWRLRGDPSAAWRAYETRLREAQEGLKLLVLQAEGEARELDRRLAAHAEQIQAQLGGGPPASVAAATARGSAASGSLPHAAPAATPRPRGAALDPAATSTATSARPTSTRAASATSARKAATPSPTSAATRPRPSPGCEPASGPSLAERVQQLAAARTPIAEIARQLSLPVAEARVLAGLTTGAAAYGGRVVPDAAATPPAAQRVAS